MEPFKKIRSKITPLDSTNVDTDQIIPKQFLKLVQRSGFGRYLFFDWRYENGDPQKPKKDFVLNKPEYSNSQILLSWDNFGCGSSREHAAWALLDYGFRVIIATSFADIFYSNAIKNGILPIRLQREEVRELFNSLDEELEVDLDKQTIKSKNKTYAFEIEIHNKRALLDGIDDIAFTLKYENKIRDFEYTMNSCFLPSNQHDD